MTPAALAAALRGTGLALGVDFAARDSATLGGMAATDAGGAQVLRHGTMRARVAGLEAVLADGSVVRRLSGLVKDNAGYDLPALLVGSEGTLAVITAVRLALVPAPAHVVTALLALGSLGEAVALVARLRAAAALAAGGRLLPRGRAASWCATTAGSPRRSPPRTRSTCWPSAARRRIRRRRSPRRSGDEAAVRDVAVADDTARRAALWTYREAHNEALNAAGVPHKLDVSVPLAGAGRRGGGDRRRRSPRRGARLYLYGHLGDGNLHVNVLGPEPDDERSTTPCSRIVAAHGGSISAEHGIGVAKRRWLGLTRTPEELAAMRGDQGRAGPRRAAEPRRRPLSAPQPGSVRDQALAAELDVGLDEREVRRRDDHVGLLELVLAELVPVRCGRGRASPRRPRGTCPRRRPRRRRPPRCRAR